MTTHREPPRELRMILVGKTGVGKSETGNTISGERVFQADISSSSVTQAFQLHTFQRDDQTLKLFDVPGFIDYKLSPEQLKEEIEKCLICCDGFHVILFLIEIGTFTDDDIKMLKLFDQFFGEKSMAHVIVVFTKLDKLKRNEKQLHDYVTDAPGPLADFLAKASLRYLGVDNWSNDDREKKSFIEELLRKVTALVRANHDSCYTLKMFQEAKRKTWQSERLDILKRLGLGAAVLGLGSFTMKKLF